MILGTVSGVLFALGMCMALLPEWNAFVPGVILGAAGLVLGIITVFAWRRLEHKKPILVSKKAVLSAVTGTVGALLLGLGMCFCMVWGKLIPGIVIGLCGIIGLMCLIPLIRGFKA